jgi:ankyrin repeat protein
MDVHLAGTVAWGYLSSWLDSIIRHASTLEPSINMLLLPLGLGVVVYVSVKCLFAYLARYHAASSLILAAKWNSTTATNMLLDAGADVTWKSDFWAEKVRHQLRSNKDSTEHPISYAAMLGHAKIVELLLQAGADIEYKHREGRSPLVLAVEANHTAVARLLIDRGADLQSTDMWGQSSLGYAATNNDDEMMDLLVKVLQERANTRKDKHNLRDADEAAESGDDSDKSIHDESDSEGGDSDQVVEEVVEEGLDDLFVYVASDGHLDRAQSLFAMGAGHNKARLSGALRLAAFKTEPAMIEFLLEEGADPNTVMISGTGRRVRTVTPLIAAVQNEKWSEEIVQLLLDHGADPRFHGDHLLFMTGRKGHVSLYKRFVELGAPVEFSFRVGSAMELAIQNRQESIVSFLVQKGYRISQEDLRSAQYAWPEIVRILEDALSRQAS